MHLALTSALARFGGLNIIVPKEVEYIVESKWVSIGIQADVFWYYGVCLVPGSHYNITSARGGSKKTAPHKRSITVLNPAAPSLSFLFLAFLDSMLNRAACHFIAPKLNALQNLLLQY